ncbi:MAG: CubicO group peptidase (beta-lactamase class C family) [Paraglaciecola sp.]|jgi:CubicO group peptidase (beta-lactamase class C family)
MSTLKYIFLTLFTALLWTAFIMHGISDGFLLKFLANDRTSEGFIEATKDKIAAEFLGNCAMVLIENGEVANEHYFSVDNQAINDQTVFQVASVSKWVTAFGVLKLVEQGKLDVDKPIDNYLSRWHLPDSDFDNKKVTIKGLLSHSSGLVDDLGYDGFDTDEPVQTIEESLTKAADAMYAEGVARVGYEPGSEYQYSGAGYTILQLIIEEVSGQSFQNYMTKEVFEPLGMKQSTFVLSEKPNLELAKLYNEDGTISPPNRFTALAAASLFTCTADLTKFLMANVFKNQVLTSEMISTMSEPVTFINKIGFYGMGPHLYSQNDEISQVIGHDGSSGKPVINTAARIDLTSKNGIIILETGNHSLASNIADEWLFEQAGIADYVVIMRNKPYLIKLYLSGILLIMASLYFIKRRKNKG